MIDPLNKIPPSEKNIHGALKNGSVRTMDYPFFINCFLLNERGFGKVDL